jgi:MtN3 and saliva related transmembrane protein
METANIFELMGTTGSLIMCASSVPQIWKTYSTKCTDGLSGFYLGILMIGMALIQIYALYVRNVVFIFGNGFSLLLTGILVGLWFRYRNRADQGRSRDCRFTPVDRRRDCGSPGDFNGCS